ncbi:acyltransferase [Candidatus Saccharibacteria bacterium]|nr:acyltransferase [Candidatus Saccharibacteria bacterium]
MKKIDSSISAIRLIAMLMIIVCHILQGLDNKWAYWVNVGVQIFFFISGFLYGKKEIRDVKDFYLKRFRRVFLPYLIVCLVCLFLELVVLKNHYPAPMLVGDVLGFGGFNGLVPILTHTWFVSYILLCYVLLPVFQNVFSGKNFRKDLIKLIILVVFIQLLQEFSVIGITVAWINNFILGYFYSRSCNGGGSGARFTVAMLLLLAVTLPFAVIYQEKLNVALPEFMNLHAEMFIQYAHVFLGATLFIAMFAIFKKKRLKYNFLLSFSDKYSYHIYLVHQIFILYSFSMLHLTGHLWVNIVLIFLCATASGVILKFVADFVDKKMVPPEGLEPTTPSSED